MNSNKINLILLFIIITSFILKLLPIRLNYFWDECVYLSMADYFRTGNNYYTQFEIRPPALSIIISLFYYIYNNTITAHIVIALISVIGSLFIYLLGKEIYNDYRVGLIASALYSYADMFVRWSHNIMTDVPSFVFFIIGLYFLLKSSPEKDESMEVRKYESKNVSYFPTFLPSYFQKHFCLSNLYAYLSGFFLALAVLTRFTILFAMPILLVFIIIRRIDMSKLFKVELGFAVLFVPYLIWIRSMFKFPCYSLITAYEGGSNAPIYGRMYYIKGVEYICGTVALIGLAFVFIGFIVSIIKNVKRHLIKYDITMGIFALLILASLINVPHKELRYIILVAIPIFILAGRGFAYLFDLANYIKSRDTKANFSLLATLTFIIIMLISYKRTFIDFEPKIFGQGRYIKYEQDYYDTVELAKYVKENIPANYSFYVNFNTAVFSFYSKKKIITLKHRYEDNFEPYYSIDMPSPGYFACFKDPKLGEYVDWRRKKYRLKPEWEKVNTDSRFRLIKDYQTLSLFEYKPGSKE